MHRILERPLPLTSACRGLPYSTDPVTIETCRAWTWRATSSTRCHVMLAKRTAILEPAKYFINLFLESFRFCNTWLYITERK